MMTGRSWCGCGTEAAALSEHETAALVGRAVDLLPDHDFTDHALPAVRDLDVAAPRVAAPDALASVFSADDNGGTITHHHAIARDHRPWYDGQRPGAFAIAMRAAKSATDPAGIPDPGVLWD